MVHSTAAPILPSLGHGWRNWGLAQHLLALHLICLLLRCRWQGQKSEDTAALAVLPLYCWWLRQCGFRPCHAHHARCVGRSTGTAGLALHWCGGRAGRGAGTAALSLHGCGHYCLSAGLALHGWRIDSWRCRHFLQALLHCRCALLQEICGFRRLALSRRRATTAPV